MARRADSSSELEVAGRPSLATGTQPALPIRLSPRIRTALASLLPSYDDAQARAPSGFGPPLDLLRLSHAGLSRQDLRWLVGRGLLAHSVDATRPPATPVDHHPDETMFTGASRFCLTASGARLAGDASHARSTSLHRGVEDVPQPHRSFATVLPGQPLQWDRNRNELRAGAIVVKRFHVGAPDQEAILAAFEEAAWADQIVNPLSPRNSAPLDARLQAAVAALNRQRQPLIEFSVDGGQLVRWQFTAGRTLASDR